MLALTHSSEQAAVVGRKFYPHPFRHPTPLPPGIQALRRLTTLALGFGAKPHLPLDHAHFLCYPCVIYHTLRKADMND